MVDQRMAVLQMLGAGFVLLSLLGAAAGNAQKKGGPRPGPTRSPTCGNYTTSGAPFQCMSHTVLNPYRRDTRDPSQSNCCQDRLSYNLRSSKPTIVLGDTVSFTLTFRSLYSGFHNITRITFLTDSTSKIVDPLPKNPGQPVSVCKYATVIKSNQPLPGVICSGFRFVLQTEVYKVTVLPLQPGFRTLESYIATASKKRGTGPPRLDNSYLDVAGVNVSNTCSAFSFTADGVLLPYQCQNGLFFTEAQANNTNPSDTTCCTTTQTSGACCNGDGSCTAGPRGSCPSKSYTPGVTCAQAKSVATNFNCTPSWLPCNPCSGPDCTECCTGSSCSNAVTFGSTQYYTCIPDASTCQPEGGPCADSPGGGVCCGEMVCKWNYGAGDGACTPPYTCGAVGGSCSTDSDCCPGTVCSSAGTCQVGKCNVGCVHN